MKIKIILSVIAYIFITSSIYTVIYSQIHHKRLVAIQNIKLITNIERLENLTANISIDFATTFNSQISSTLNQTKIVNNYSQKFVLQDNKLLSLDNDAVLELGVEVFKDQYYPYKDPKAWLNALEKGSYELYSNESNYMIYKVWSEPLLTDYKDLLITKFINGNLQTASAENDLKLNIKKAELIGDFNFYLIIKKDNYLVEEIRIENRGPLILEAYLEGSLLNENAILEQNLGLPTSNNNLTIKIEDYKYSIIFEDLTPKKRQGIPKNKLELVLYNFLY